MCIHWAVLGIATPLCRSNGSGSPRVSLNLLLPRCLSAARARNAAADARCTPHARRHAAASRSPLAQAKNACRHRLTCTRAPRLRLRRAAAPPRAAMALITLDGLDGLLMACESARLSQETLAEADPGAAVVRAPRTARAVKRRVEPVDEPARPRAPAAKRPKPAAGQQPAPANPGHRLVPRARAPRSPDEKRKLSRQMAAFMRLGVLVLPADVKARAP